MSNELVALDKSNLTPSQIGDYIHTIKEVEKNILTLEVMEKELNEKKTSLKTQIKKLKPKRYHSKEIPSFKLIDEQEELKQINTQIKCSKKREIEHAFTANNTLPIPGAIFWPLVVAAILFGFLCLVRLFGLSIRIVISASVFILFSTICIAKNIRIKKEINEKLEKEKTQQVANLKSRINRQNEEIHKKTEEINYHNQNLDSLNEKAQSDYQKNKEEKEKEFTFIENEATFIHSKFTELKDICANLYSVGIIPPDYRTMDCVYVFDQIFRNDLADNMRQAVALYEERVFRGEIIKGMGTIIDKLDSLQGTMSNLVSDIYSVKQNVSFMSQDVFRMAEAQSKHNDKMLENSKATRYAMETVQKHSEEAKKYFGY